MTQLVRRGGPALAPSATPREGLLARWRRLRPPACFGRSRAPRWQKPLRGAAFSVPMSFLKKLFKKEGKKEEKKEEKPAAEKKEEEKKQ